MLDMIYWGYKTIDVRKYNFESTNHSVNLAIVKMFTKITNFYIQMHQNWFGKTVRLQGLIRFKSRSSDFCDVDNLPTYEILRLF